MARLVYSAMCSLDGFIADADGSFDFAMPDAAVHAFANELESTVGTHLFGRRMFEVMEFWEGQDADLDQDPVTLEFARQWTSRDKHVYSTTLTSVTTARTTLHRAFEPQQVAQLKADATADLSIGGAALAAVAFRAGLIDDLHLITFPVVVGGGTSALPPGLRLDLERAEVRLFDSGVVATHYRVHGQGAG